MPQSTEDQELEQDKTYHKSIDALIEDAEIEAEIEAEKHIRSKNTRLVTISLVGIALIGFIYWQVSETTSRIKINEAALPELTKAQSVEQTSAVESAVEPEPASSAPEEPKPQSSEKVAGVEKPESVPPVSEKPEPVVPVAKAKVEPEAVKAKPTVAPAEKKSEPEIKKVEPVITESLPKEPASRPIINTVASQPAKVKAPATTPAVKKHFVQLGSFSIENNAKGFLKQVKNKGFNPSILIKSGRASKHVVFVGGFSTKESGRKALQDLESKGFKSVMQKLDDNSYTIVLGKFATSSQAEVLRDKLSLAGFLSSSSKSKVSSVIYIVQLGGFDGLRQAKLMQKKVGRAGYIDSFIR
jgi:cell division protein FtsN